MFLSFFDAINLFNKNNYEFTPGQRKTELFCVTILLVIFSVLFTFFIIKAIKQKNKSDKENITKKYDGEK